MVAFHDPFDGAFAVDGVVPGFGGDVLNGDGAVVDDGVFLSFFGEAHFFDGEVAGFGAGDGDILRGRNGFVVEVEVGEFAACLAEAPEVAGLFDEGDTGEHLFQVVGKTGAIFGAVEDAVDVVEDIFFGDAVAVHFLCAFEDEVGKAVAPDMLVFCGCVKERRAGFLALFVGSAEKALKLYFIFD